MITEDNKKSAEDTFEPKLYKKRWLMLLVYVVVAPTSTIQWSQFTIVADVIVEHYQVSYEAVNWTNMIALLCYVIFAFPCCYAIDKYGIRKSLLITTLATCVGTWIKVFSVSSDKFWVVILGQLVLSIPQACLLNLPPKLAAYWFGASEVSTACSIAVCGIHVGAALGFILPPILVKKDTVELDLFVTAVGLAIICTISFLLVFAFFSNKPPVPPSYAAINQDVFVDYRQSLKLLFKNVPLLYTIVGSGLNVATYCVLQSLLNQIIVNTYANGTEDAGWIGFLLTAVGVLGFIVAGITLDYFKIYRISLVALDLLIIPTLIVFTYTLNENILFPYLTCSFFGFLAFAKWSVTYQIAIETSYPEPEGAVVGLINMFGQSSAIPLTYIYSFIFYEYNDFWANIFLTLIHVIGFFCTLLSKFELKRFLANSKKASEVPEITIQSNLLFTTYPDLDLYCLVLQTLSTWTQLSLIGDYFLPDTPQFNFKSDIRRDFMVDSSGADDHNFTIEEETDFCNSKILQLNFSLFKKIHS